MENKIQKSKVGMTGSFINQLMSNNSSLPIVGLGATQLHYSDRTCYEVIDVSADGKTARLEYLDAEADKSVSCDMGHQNWILKPSNRFVTVTWRNNAWRTVGTEIVFNEQYIKYLELIKGIQYIGIYLRKNFPKLADEIYGTDGSPRPVNVVEGITRQKKVYNKINILFGVKDYYYDWSF
jgi:hypothetical protein